MFRTDQIEFLLCRGTLSAKWKATPKGPTQSTNGFLMESDGTVAGYRCLSSRQLASGTFKDRVLFGKFSDLVLGLWGVAAVNGRRLYTGTC
jgi:hypothetical protein